MSNPLLEKSRRNTDDEIISHNELTAMNGLAKTNPGMKDLLGQAKVYYELAKVSDTPDGPSIEDILNAIRARKIDDD